MSTVMTLFTAALQQDSALSVSGLDRETTSDQPFTIVDGVPVLSGRGIKGAAVAMARRFFDPLPRSISEARDREQALCRSAWEVDNATPTAAGVKPQLRPGVGILQKTGARATGVLYDREVIPAGTTWALQLRVDWRLVRKVQEEHAEKATPEEVEGILGYVLQEQWQHERCWLGGGAARGLGWCHVAELRAYRLDTAAYDRWVTGRRSREALPAPLARIPTAKPTRSWSFHTCDLTIRAGEYRPDPQQPAWGVDMLAIAPHSQETTSQRFEPAHWARPPWASRSGGAAETGAPAFLETDRAIAMEGRTPLLPGSSLRGPLRHAFSRRVRHVSAKPIADPHLSSGALDEADEGGRVFGTVARSSQVLIRDGRAEGEWHAARLHMHAEDEFSAGSYGSAKRNAARLLRGSFPMRIVVEGPCRAEVERLVKELTPLLALGELGHLPIGGHKTRGAGWGPWTVGTWDRADVEVPRSTEATRPAVAETVPKRNQKRSLLPLQCHDAGAPIGEITTGWLEIEHPPLGVEGERLSLGAALERARAALGGEPTCWWCEPRIDLRVKEAPATFGSKAPEGSTLDVDEVVFFTAAASWRAARTASGWRTVLLREVKSQTGLSRAVEIREVPTYLHVSRARFNANLADKGRLRLREWSAGGQVLGYTASYSAEGGE